MVKVSFIIGTHNGSSKLHTMFESLMSQSFSDFEVIICNDASSDNTYNILLEYAEKYPEKIKVLNNEKSLTLAGSLNKCLVFAEGEYIARIDDDDYCYSDRLYKQVGFLDKHSDIDCVGSFMDLYDGINVTGTRLIVEKPNIEVLLKGGYPFHHPTIMIRKTVLVHLNGYNNSKECKRCEDLDLWYRFFILGYKGYNLQESLVRYSESIEDYNKRTFSSVINAYNIRKLYRKKISWNFFLDILYLKPVLFSLFPNNIRYFVKRNRKY